MVSSFLIIHTQNHFIFLWQVYAFTKISSFVNLFLFCIPLRDWSLLNIFASQFLCLKSVPCRREKFWGSDLHAVKRVEACLVCENLSTCIPMICTVLSVCYTLIKSKQADQNKNLHIIYKVTFKILNLILNPSIIRSQSSLTRIISNTPQK